MTRRNFSICAAAAIALVGLVACVAEGGGGAEVDYYGPAYGGAWWGGPGWYGHPDYRGGAYVSHPPAGQHFAPRPSGGHAAPAAHASGRGGDDHRH